MHAFEAIICVPGYRAQAVEIVATREALRRFVGGGYKVAFPFRGKHIALICNERNYGPERYGEPGLRPNRAHPDDDNAIPVRFYCGNILFLDYGGSKGQDRKLRSLTSKEAAYLMDVFGRPDFPRPILLGLVPGEELEIISGMEFARMSPEHVAVVSEREGFITVRLYFSGWNLARSYMATLDKNSILCGDLRVRRKSTMEELRDILMSGRAIDPADFVSNRKG